MNEILLGIAKLTPVVGVLVTGIYYFFNKEKTYITKIDELNKILRDKDKETLEIIGKLTVTLDKLIESDSTSKNEIINEIRNLRDIIITKIDNIK